jgi:hypothetical protein
MNYKWTINNYPPTIHDGECIETGKKIGGVTHCVTTDGIPFFTYVGRFSNLSDAKEALIKEYEKNNNIKTGDQFVGNYPIRQDAEVIQKDSDHIGFECHILKHGDKYPDPTGNMNDTDYIGNYNIPKSSTSIDVLPFLIGKPYNNLAWNWIVGLRPSQVRVSTGIVHLDCYPNRITIFIDKDNIIKSIQQEISVGCIGVHHAHDLEMATNDPSYKQETYVNSIIINKKVMEKLFNE